MFVGDAIRNLREIPWFALDAIGQSIVLGTARRNNGYSTKKSVLVARVQNVKVPDAVESTSNSIFFQWTFQ